jgi:uncharacterized protein
MFARAVIDSLEFARTEQTLRGRLPVPGFPRLRESLYDPAGEVEFAVTGGHDTRRRPTLTLDINGVLHLRCQRCLGILDYPLRLMNTLLLVGRAEMASAELADEQVECIEGSAELDLEELIEDEIILSLPYAPRHEEGRCGHGLGVIGNGAKVSAFSGLATLKKVSH